MSRQPKDVNKPWYAENTTPVEPAKTEVKGKRTFYVHGVTKNQPRIDPTNPFAAHIQGELAMTQNAKAPDIAKGKDALRYLLNISEEQPRAQFQTILDKTQDDSGVTTRERLEALWRALHVEP